MQRTLRNQGVVILPRKPSRRMQRTRNTAHGLKLTSTVTDALFINRKCLSEEFVADFFEPGLICDLACCEEQAEDQLGDG